MWNELELPDGSYSVPDIQDCKEFIHTHTHTHTHKKKKKKKKKHYPLILLFMFTYIELIIDDCLK